MEGETEGMPYDDRKDDFVKSYSKGKSKAMKRALRDAKNDFLIVKTVNAKDAKHLVDEEGCLRECLCAGVAYSMNRRQRWDRLSAKNVLSDVANTKTSIGVLENWNTAKRGENLASAYHEVRNGIMTTRKAHHLAANANTLIEKPKPKRRGSKAKRELAAAVEMGVDGEQTSTPKVTYTISRAHPSAAKWKIPTKKGPKVTVKKRVKPIYDDIVEEDDEREITDTEKEIDENEALIEGHPRSFDISEFVVQPPSREVVVKAPSIESLESTVASQSLTAPFELVTFPKEVREVSLSLALRIRVRRWHDFDFDKDAKELIASGQYPHTWLTHGDGVLALDLTQAVVGHSQSYPHLTAVFERPFNNIMSVHINGAFTLNISYEQVIAELFNSRPKSLVGFVTSLIQCAMDWNEEEFYHSLKQFAFPELRREDVITLAESHFYYRIYQSEMLAGTLSIVPFEKMAEEIEKDHESRTTRDDFESLENEWNEAVCSICRLALRAGLCKLGCLHGICTDCLRESITGQIRQGISPVKCHDENCDCAIPIGLIRVLLPVPLYIFYVKFSYMQMKKRNNEEVRSCPLCLQAGVVTSKSYRSLCCSACATCFCEECEKMPHWPLTCNEFDDWSEKFEPQYEMEKCRLDGKLKEYLVTRRCHFGELIEAPDNIGVQKCSTCLLTYDWATGRSIVDCRCYVGKDEQGMPVWKRPEAEFVSQRKPLTMVNRQFAPICASARRKRFEEVKVTNMIAKCTHQSQPSGQILNARRVVDLRNTSLYLVEYGTAWLFEHRMSPPDNWKQIRNQVTKLEHKLDIVVARLSSKTDSELSVQQCSQAISSLEALVAAIISLLQLSA